MIWIAPIEKDTASAALEERRCCTPDQFRANSGLKAHDAAGILYLPAEARFDYLLNRPEAENIGAKVNDAMRDIARGIHEQRKALRRQLQNLRRTRDPLLPRLLPGQANIAEN